MSVPKMSGSSQLHLSQQQGERHGSGRNQHQRPKHIYKGKQRCLSLDLLTNPGDGLLLALPIELPWAAK
jgi:hypothetical protein